MDTENCWNPAGKTQDLRQQFRSSLATCSSTFCPPYNRQNEEEVICRKFQEVKQSDWSFLKPFQSLEEVPDSALKHERLPDRFLDEEAPQAGPGPGPGPRQVVTEEPVEDAEAGRFADTVFEYNSGHCAGAVPWWDVVPPADIAGKCEERISKACFEESQSPPAEPELQQVGLCAGSVPWCLAETGGSNAGRCEEAQCISDIFTACESAEDLQISVLWPCPSPKTEDLKPEVLMRPAKSLEGQAMLHSPADDEFVAGLLEVSSVAEPEVIEDAPGSIVNLRIPSQHRPVAEEVWPPLFRKPRSAKTMARNRSICQHIRLPKVEEFDDSDELTQRTGHQVNSEVIAYILGGSDVKTSLVAKADVSDLCGLRPSATIRCSPVTDKELVQVLVSLRRLRKSPAETADFISNLDYTLTLKDLYKCSEESFDKLASSGRSPQYFIMYTRYSGGSSEKKVTRLRSPPTRRASKKEPTPQCRRWMQRGKSKIFRHGGPAYGKTYFSYGLRDFEGRRKRLAKKKPCRKQRRQGEASELALTDKAEAESQGMARFEREESWFGYARKRRKLSRTGNDFQMYELYLEEDMVKDKEQRKLNKAPKPYPVICVLRYV